jgi:hypothetical protein
MSEGALGEDPYLDHLKEARKRPAVLKLRLASLRSEAPDIIVFAFEGDDDKIVYSQWIRRILPALEYEPFPCGGKKEVLQLREVVLRDVSGIGGPIYFFVDRDFDDLPEGCIDDDTIFMTSRYSVENYLVTAEVLVELLKNEFHCHGRPDVREPIKARFEADYLEFLAVTKEVNWRLFVARKLRIELQKPLPKKVSSLAAVALEAVGQSEIPMDDIVAYAVEPPEESVVPLVDEFESLDAPGRYRGKFAMRFFQRWLELLGAEYAQPALGLFGDIDRSSRARLSELTIGNYASKSNLPSGLPAFLDQLAA